MDVVDCLEKRVKSRFGHRWVHVPSVKSIEGLKEVLERVLCIEDEVGAAMDDKDVNVEEMRRWNEYIKVRHLPSRRRWTSR